MNPTLLTDYQQKLSIAMAKIEVCDMIIEQLEQGIKSVKNDDDYLVMVRLYAENSLEKQLLYIAGYSDGLKQRIHTHWQTLEPKPTEYGYNAETDSWDSVLNAQRYNMAHARWQNIEPFKTIQNDPA